MPRGKRKNLEEEESDHEMSEKKSEWIVGCFCFFLTLNNKATESKSEKEKETKAPIKSRREKMKTVAAPRGE